MNNIEIKYKKIDALIPYVNNTRTHSDDQVTQICSSDCSAIVRLYKYRHY